MNVYTFVLRPIVHQIVVKFHDKNNAVVVSMFEITCHVGYTDRVPYFTRHLIRRCNREKRR